MSLDYVDDRAHTPLRVRTPAPSEEEVRVSDRVDVSTLDMTKDRKSLELALVAHFEQLRDPRLTSLGGLPVDTSERRWMVAMGVADLFEEVKNLGKNNSDDAEQVRKEQEEATNDDQNEVIETPIQTTDPRSRIDTLLGNRDGNDSTRRMTSMQAESSEGTSDPAKRTDTALRQERDSTASPTSGREAQSSSASTSTSSPKQSDKK